MLISSFTLVQLLQFSRNNHSMLLVLKLFFLRLLYQTTDQSRNVTFVTFFSNFSDRHDHLSINNYDQLLMRKSTLEITPEHIKCDTITMGHVQMIATFRMRQFHMKHKYKNPHSPCVVRVSNHNINSFRRPEQKMRSGHC